MKKKKFLSKLIRFENMAAICFLLLINACAQQTNSPLSAQASGDDVLYSIDSTQGSLAPFSDASVDAQMPLSAHNTENHHEDADAEEALLIAVSSDEEFMSVQELMSKNEAIQEYVEEPKSIYESMSSGLIYYKIELSTGLKGESYRKKLKDLPMVKYAEVESIYQVAN